MTGAAAELCVQSKGKAKRGARLNSSPAEATTGYILSRSLRDYAPGEYVGISGEANDVQGSVCEMSCSRVFPLLVWCELGNLTHQSRVIRPQSSPVAKGPDQLAISSQHTQFSSVWVRVAPTQDRVADQSYVSLENMML